MDYQAFAAERRGELLERLGGDAVLLLGGDEIPIHLSDECYPFSQDPNFLYLSGVREPGYALLLGAEGSSYELFIPRVDMRYRVWMGEVPEPDSAQELYHADRVSYTDELAARAREALVGHDRLHVVTSSNTALEDVLAEITAGLAGIELDRASADRHLVAMRLIKQPLELELMREAARITHRSYLEMWKVGGPGRNEREVLATLERVLFESGAKEAFCPIIASGSNPACLHYRRNDCEMRAGEMLLIDSGAEWRGYKADVTRTVPVEGRWEGLRRAVYEVVLEAQKRAIDGVRAGVDYPDLHLSCARDLMAGLAEMGVVRGELDGLMERRVYQLFMPHGLGHPIGLETHDVGGHAEGRELSEELKAVNLRTNRVLEEGMVVTIEPGIYFNALLLASGREDERVRSAVDWERAEACLAVGGVRIEDDVVVTAGDPENLTAAIPKEISAIPVG